MTIHQAPLDTAFWTIAKARLAALISKKVLLALAAIVAICVLAVYITDPVIYGIAVSGIAAAAGFQIKADSDITREALRREERVE